MSAATHADILILHQAALGDFVLAMRATWWYLSTGTAGSGPPACTSHVDRRTSHVRMQRYPATSDADLQHGGYTAGTIPQAVHCVCRQWHRPLADVLIPAQLDHTAGQHGWFTPIRVPSASAGKSVRKDAPVRTAPLRGFPRRLRSRLGPAWPVYVRGGGLATVHLLFTAYTRSHAASRLGLQSSLPRAVPPCSKVVVPHRSTTKRLHRPDCTTEDIESNNWHTLYATSPEQMPPCHAETIRSARLVISFLGGPDSPSGRMIRALRAARQSPSPQDVPSCSNVARPHGTLLIEPRPSEPYNDHILSFLAEQMTAQSGISRKDDNISHASILSWAESPAGICGSGVTALLYIGAAQPLCCRSVLPAESEPVQAYVAGSQPEPAVPDRNAEGRAVVLHPGSGGVHKCWPTERFCELARRLAKLTRQVHVLVGPAEYDRFGASFAEQFRPYATIHDNQPLDIVARLLGQAGLYVGNDSGVTHLAASMGVPTVALFGPSDARVWRPLGLNVRIVQAEGADMRQLSIEQVWAAVSAMIMCDEAPPG